MKIKVTRVELDTDLRTIHEVRLGVQCRPGEAVLFINRAANRARLIDSTQAVHNYYADEGEVFDLTTIQAAVKGLGLTLEFTAKRAKARVAKVGAGHGRLREAA